MVGSYSPNSDAGGTLHLPSPTHLHHVDPTSAFKQLRRSLSRSPSKVPTFRLVTSKSASPSLPSSPLSPPRDHGPNRSISTSIFPTTNCNAPSPLNTPVPTCPRKTRTPTRRLSPMRNTPRPVGTPRSPRKRQLNESANAGNIAPRSSASSSDDQENIPEGSFCSPEYPIGGGRSRALDHCCKPTAPCRYLGRPHDSRKAMEAGARSQVLLREAMAS